MKLKAVQQTNKRGYMKKIIIMAAMVATLSGCGLTLEDRQVDTCKKEVANRLNDRNVDFLSINSAVNNLVIINGMTAMDGKFKAACTFDGERVKNVMVATGY